MDITNKQYDQLVKQSSPPSRVVRDCILAFVIGGLICTVAECFNQLYITLGISKDTSLLLASLTIILLTALATGFGFFDKIAKFGGGGALVPISGFANAVTSQGIESKSEGFITGVASKMFTIAGPVIVYGVSSSIIYGLIYYILF